MWKQQNLKEEAVHRVSEAEDLGAWAWRSERVFLLKLSERTGESRKLARPFHGLYRIVSMDMNTAHVRKVDKPQEDTILVAVDRLRR